MAAWRLAPALSAIFLCAACAAPQKPLSEVTDADKKQAAAEAKIVEELLKDGDLTRANAVADQVMQHDPYAAYNNMVVARARAAQAVVNGDPRTYDDAVRQAGFACDAAPDSAAAFYTRGKLQYDRNYFDYALLDLQKAIELDPKLTDARLLIVRSHRKLRQPIAEKKALEDLITAEPNEAIGFTELGTRLVASDEATDVSRGKQLLTHATELDPQNDVALHQLAELAVDDGNLADAEALLRRAAAAAAGRPVREADALYNLGSVLHQEGKSADARAAYERCLALDPEDRRALGNLGILLAAAGEKDEAQKRLRAAIERETDAGVKKKLEDALKELEGPKTAKAGE